MSGISVTSKDPYYREGLKYYDMWDWGWGMPSDPHASDNLRYAVGWLATGDPEADEWLEFIVRRYVGGKYHDHILSDARHVAKMAARNVDNQKET